MRFTDFPAWACIALLSGCVARIDGEIIPFVDPGHHIFVTSSVTTGSFGVAGDPILAGDEECQRRADAAGLGRRYLAILSTPGNHARDRWQTSRPVSVYSSGEGFVRVVDRLGDLWTASSLPLRNAVEFNEFGTSLRDDLNRWVWTGTISTGFASTLFHCSAWTQSSGSGQTGELHLTNNRWISHGGTVCNLTARFYCMSASPVGE